MMWIRCTTIDILHNDFINKLKIQDLKNCSRKSQLIITVKRIYNSGREN